MWGVDPRLVVEWASKVDAGPFSSLGTLEIVTSYSYEPLTVLAAAAAVTKRVRLMTNIIVGPVRNSLTFAKQTLSINAMSGGRLTVGLAVGSREIDYYGAPVPFSRRGRGFDEQIALLKWLWAGGSIRDNEEPIGPLSAQNEGPELLIGGYAPDALARAGRWGDGYIASGHALGLAQAAFTTAQEAWRAAGRTGSFRFVGMQPFALGPRAQEQGEVYVRNFYSASSQMQTMLDTFYRTPEQIRDALRACADIGMDELVLMPAIAELDQVDRLAEVIG